MALSKLKEFASLKGWKFEKNIASGEENNYLFTVISGQGVKIFICPLPSISEENKNQVLNHLTYNKKLLKISSFLFDHDMLIIKFKENYRRTKIETMNNLLINLTNLLNSLGIKGKECCIFCGHDNANETIYFENVMYSAHSECYTQQVEMIETAAREYESENKNYLRGAIGALIGGILISIPWSFAQVYLSNNLAAIFSTLLSLGLLKSYYLFKGKLGSATRWIIAACTFISAIISQLLVVEIMMLQHGTTIEYSDLIGLFGISGLAAMFRLNVKLSLFIAFIGFLLFVFPIKGSTKSVLPKIEKK
ncbi:hypothetical protein [Clostridium sp. 'White wine YQ']|uniref:hypothetical protein n=1 Tax=Clostridium sp. 'White wine YQ' TaxID=3027474 RepID=UPI002366BCEC|nr:hypothetical protein [Clostridium sp. 'White wine YQ']MDD7793846.1 hypothetical protein [Clostridium sp. 'White wine YQ']